jgi:hypothetical protein
LKVFLSHSSRNRKKVRNLARDLREFGFDVWLDEWEIKGGDSITQKIQKGLEDSDIVAVWLTEHAINSGWVEREWMSKFSKEIHKRRSAVIPLLAQKCAIPYLLKDYKYINFRNNYFVGLRTLVDVLDPNHSAYAAALRNIKEKTTFLWGELKRLPDNRNATVCCEIRESSYDSILQDLHKLAEVGNFFKFSVEDAGYISKGKTVIELRIHAITARVFQLIKNYLDYEVA